MTSWSVTSTTRHATGDETTTDEAITAAFTATREMVRDHERTQITVTVGGWDAKVTPQHTDAGADQDIANTEDALDHLEAAVRSNLLPR